MTFFFPFYPAIRKSIDRNLSKNNFAAVLTAFLA